MADNAVTTVTIGFWEDSAAEAVMISWVILPFMFGFHNIVQVCVHESFDIINSSNCTPNLSPNCTPNCTPAISEKFAEGFRLLLKSTSISKASALVDTGK